MLIKNLKKGFTPLNNSERNLTGFTLLELVITVGIIAFALVGLLAFSINLLKTVSLSKNQLIAYNLAEEGAEILNHLGQGCVGNGSGGCLPNQGGVCGYVAGTSNYIVIADSNPQDYPEGFVGNRCTNYSVVGVGDDSQFMLNLWNPDTEKLYLCPAGYIHSSSPIFNPNPLICKPTPFKRKIVVEKVDLFNEYSEGDPRGWRQLENFIGRRYRFISEVRWDSPFGEQKVSIPTHVIHFIRID